MITQAIVTFLRWLSKGNRHRKPNVKTLPSIFMQRIQLTKPKSGHTAWLLAVVLFFSGLSFSSSVAYARERQVKARTELVVSTKNPAGKTFSPKHQPTHPAEATQVKFIHRIEVHSTLYTTQLKHVNKKHHHFSSILKNILPHPVRVSDAYTSNG